MSGLYVLCITVVVNEQCLDYNIDSTLISVFTHINHKMFYFAIAIIPTTVKPVYSKQCWH